jgi:subtilisin-like proprotein convertase family protein
MPMAIPDRSSISIPIGVTTNTTISDLNVRLNVSHLRVGDLVVQLRAPNGTKITLANRRGGNGSGYTNTLFDDSATRSVVTAASPFATSVRPEDSLGRFRGQSTQGTWTLIIADVAGGVVGRVNSASLEFNAPTDGTTVRRAAIDSDMRPDAIVTALQLEFQPHATFATRPMRAETLRLLGDAARDVVTTKIMAADQPPRTRSHDEHLVRSPRSARNSDVSQQTQEELVEVFT